MRTYNYSAVNVEICVCALQAVRSSHTIELCAMISQLTSADGQYCRCVVELLDHTR